MQININIDNFKVTCHNERLNQLIHCRELILMYFDNKLTHCVLAFLPVYAPNYILPIPFHFNVNGCKYNSENKTAHTQTYIHSN